MAPYPEKSYIFEFLTLENTRGRFRLPGPRSSWARKGLEKHTRKTSHVRTVVGRRRSRPWSPGMENRGSRPPICDARGGRRTPWVMCKFWEGNSHLGPKIGDLGTRGPTILYIWIPTPSISYA